MRTRLFSIGLMLALAGAADAPPAAVLGARPGAVAHGGDAPRGFRSLDQRGMERDGVLYVPTGYDPARPAPLVVLLHGAGGSPRRAVDGLQRLAEAKGVIVMAPASRGTTWDLVADGRFGADARMLDALLRQLFVRYSIDPRRITVAGFSDGGSYALSLGLSNGDLFGRVLAFSPGFVRPARQAGKPPLFISHGRTDTVLPIDATGRRVAALLRRAGYDVRLVEFDGGHAVPPAIAAEAMALVVTPSPSAGGAAPAAIPLAEPSVPDDPPLESLLWPDAPRRVARWTDPVCFRVVGAASTLAQQIEATMLSTAVAAGVPLAGRPCRANATLELVRAPAKPAAWRYARRADRPGQPPALRAVTIRVDKARAEALPAATIGAWAALVAYAEIDRPAIAAAGPTVLALFDDAQAPQGLTTRDFDLLRRLYAAPVKTANK